MCKKSLGMHIGSLFPISSLLRRKTLIPTAPEKMRRGKSFGHLSSPSRKTRLGSLHAEKMEFLKLTLLIRQTIIISSFSQFSRANQILKSLQKSLALSNPMGEITVDPKGVFKLLIGLNINNASGLDGLSARVLKECCSEIAPILALIYNESLAQGTVPDDWRQANVAPVFKKGEKYDAANYRLVSLTCICCKTLGHIIVSNINKHFAFESILADCQHCFRSQRSCETQLVQFYRDMVSNLDGALNPDYKQTDVVIMDFEKAFDKVPLRRILYKLDYYGIRGSTHKWISSWLSERSQKWCWMAKPQIQSRSYLVFPKDQS